MVDMEFVKKFLIEGTPFSQKFHHTIAEIIEDAKLQPLTSLSGGLQVLAKSIRTSEQEGQFLTGLLLGVCVAYGAEFPAVRDALDQLLDQLMKERRKNKGENVISFAAHQKRSRA